MVTSARRTPLQLAALACAAIPGLEPTTVETVYGDDDRCDVAWVRDTKGRRWTVRVPRTAADAAQMESAAMLLPSLDRALDFTVPAEAGNVPLRDMGRAMVHEALDGERLDLVELPAGPGLASALGRALAAIHDLDPQMFDEAGVPVYDAETCRGRHLALLDRAAATGRVPQRLLQRWEKALETVAHWRFAATPVHGRLSGELVMASFADREDAATGTITAVTGWDQARVGDPADDFAALWAEASPEAFDSVLEAYAAARHERPDRALEMRARLVSELQLVRDLLHAVNAGDDATVEAVTADLKDLDEDVKDDQLTAHVPPVTAPAAPPAAAPTPSEGEVGQDGRATTVGDPVDEPLEDGDPTSPADVTDVDGHVESLSEDDGDEYVVDTTHHTTVHLTGDEVPASGAGEPSAPARDRRPSDA